MDNNEKALKFCRRILTDVSRSFALTIPMLDKSIYKEVMITYLQDRLLDNFEDEITGISLRERKYLMDKVVEIFSPEESYPQEALAEIMGKAKLFNDKGLRRLTENADTLRKAYETLEPSIKKISFKWLVEMNQGMQKYLSKEVETFADLDEYCYYVAGTVGGFLTETIIYQEKVEKPESEILKKYFIDAGLFLQKINLIRDIKKDIKNREKHYWPLVSLGINEQQLLESENSKDALVCLQEMIDNVCSHITGLVKYYQAIPESLPGYRRFYCVNNALGMATIEKIKNNPALFSGAKKIKVPRWQFLQIIKSPEKYFREKTSKYI